MRTSPRFRWSLFFRGAVIGVLVLVALGLGGADAPLLPEVASAAPAAQAACSPRPRVQLNVTNTDANTLSVVVSVSPTSSGPANALQVIRFGAARSATIDVPGGPTGSVGNFDQAYPAGTTQASFVVHRAGGAMTVPFTVVDVCGNWPTFVGAGSSLGQATPTPTPGPNYPAPGSRLYALAINSPHLAVLDTATNQLLTTVKFTDDDIVQTSRTWPDANTDPPELLVHPSGKQVYLTYRVAPSGPNVLVAVDTVTNQVVNRFSLPGYDCGTNFGLTLAPDGGHLMVHCDPVLVIDVPTLTQFKQMQISPAAGDGRPIFDATGQFLLAATSTGVKKVDISTGLVVKSVNLGGDGGHLVLDVPHNRLYVERNLTVLDATTLDPIAIGTGGQLQPGFQPSGASFIALAAGGSRLIASSGGCSGPFCDGSASAFDTSTGAQVANINFPWVPGAVAGHPTAERAYIIRLTDFLHGNPPRPQLTFFNVAGNFQSTTGTGRNGIMGFSADGSQVYVALDAGIEVYNALTFGFVRTLSTMDGSGRFIGPVSSVDLPSAKRSYVAMKDFQDGLIGTGGVLVLDTTSGTVAAFTPIFDLKRVALLP